MHVRNDELGGWTGRFIQALISFNGGTAFSDETTIWMGDQSATTPMYNEDGYELQSLGASVDRSKPAIYGHRKTGHFRRPETGIEVFG